mgnify:CR=1 FL=1
MEQREPIPACIDKSSNLCICRETYSGIYFDKRSEKEWHSIKDLILSEYKNIDKPASDLKWVIFCHNRCSFSQIEEIEKEDAYEYTLDYSSGDKDQYEAMWNDISTASNCCELVERLEYWVKHYTIDPVSRIKHRAINLFHAISLDCQKLSELAESKDKKQLKAYLNSLSDLWKSSGISPTEKLKIFWYMLVGKALENGRYVPKDYEEVSLPGNINLYSWLRKIKSDDSIKNWKDWNEFLEHCQLQKIEGSEAFSLSNKPGIYDNCLFLERLINLNRDLNYNDVLSEEYLKIIMEQSEKFVEWLTNLNELFEKLIKCLEKPS